MEKIIIYADEDLKGLIPGYLENTMKGINLIKEYVDKEQYQLVKKTAHQLKGSGRSFGFDFITEYGQSIEKAAINEEGDKIIKLVKDFINYSEKISIKYVSEDDL